MTVSLMLQSLATWALSILIGWIMINPLVRILTYQFLTKLYGQPGSEHPTYKLITLPKYQWWLPRIVGAIEQTIAMVSVFSGHYEAIGIWLVMKTTGAWSTQHKDAHPSALTTDYSIFLIGTALSVGLGIGTAVIIQTYLPLF